MSQLVVLEPGAFYDSITLMLASREADGLPEVDFAGAVMATPLNLELLRGQGFIFPEEARPGPNDLVLAVMARTQGALSAAISALQSGLATPRRGALASASPPRSLRAAVRANDGLNLAFLSVPGRHVAYEIAEALDLGLNVFCFSEGPDLATEALLKRRALEQDVLLMGPECGTALLNGVALGFGNALREGPVGIVGASGTGIQEVSCLLDAAGVGISHAVGVGGRDLSEQVGGIMTIRALELLSADPSTAAILVIAKAPHGDVAKAVVREAEATGKPTVVAFPGIEAETFERVAATSTVTLAATLEDAARLAAGIAGRDLPAAVETSPPPHSGAIRGLFSGGTLCYEAMALVSAAVGPVRSNIPLRPEWHLDSFDRAEGTVFLDFGNGAFTEGRVHPMIDYRLRLESLEVAAANPDVAVVLLDVVLGFGSHPDPASELAPVIERLLQLRKGSLCVVVAMCGTSDDRQNLHTQVRKLEDAGAFVARGTATAARLALRAAGSEVTP
jgi:FdrA protein